MRILVCAPAYARTRSALADLGCEAAGIGKPNDTAPLQRIP
jgi:predicted transcriptional regulator